MLRLVGLSGKPGAGKDSVTEFVRKQGWHVVAISEPIYKHVAELFNIELHELYDRALKNQIVPSLGKSRRQLLQEYGDAVRSIYPEAFIEIVARKAAAQSFRPSIVSDVRLLEEFQWIEGSGGEIWRIERPGYDDGMDEQTGKHRLENELDSVTFDEVIMNDGTLADLNSRIVELLKSKGCKVTEEEMLV